MRRMTGGLWVLIMLAACQIIAPQSRSAPPITPTPTATPIPTASARQLSHPSIPSRISLDDELIYTMAVSPDAQTLAAATRHGVFVYRAEDFRPLWFGAATRPLKSLAFSPTGQIIATGSNDGYVTLWETATAARLDVLPQQGGSITSLDWSPDGTLLAIAAGNSVILWDIERRTPRHLLHHPQGIIHTLSFSPDGTLLGSGADDNFAMIWHVQAGIPVAAIEHRHPVTAMTWRVYGGTRDDWLLTTGTSAGTISLWDIRPDGRMQALLYDWKGHRFEITDLHYAADRDRLLSAGRDGRITIWDIVAGERIIAYQAHETWAMGAVWSEDDTKVISAGWNGELIRWDVED